MDDQNTQKPQDDITTAEADVTIIPEPTQPEVCLHGFEHAVQIFPISAKFCH